MMLLALPALPSKKDDSQNSAWRRKQCLTSCRIIQDCNTVVDCQRGRRRQPQLGRASAAPQPISLRPGRVRALHVAEAGRRSRRHADHACVVRGP